MNKWIILGLLVLGVCCLVGSIFLRVYSQGKYEVKSIDVVFIVLPLLFVALVTGRVTGLDLFGVKADLSKLWADAVETGIDDQIEMVPQSLVSDSIEMIETAQKRGVDEIPRLIEQKTQALAFELGMGGYHGPTIRKYLDDLYGSSYLRYVVVNHPDNTLYGMYIAADLIAYLRPLENRGYERFEQTLNDGGDQSKNWLMGLPGFIPANTAITADTSKLDALQRMEELSLGSLPVVDQTGGLFVGTVDREDLTTSLILAVTKKFSDNETTGEN